MDFYDEDGNITGTAIEAMAEEMDSDDYAGFIETLGEGRRGGDRGRKRRLQQNSLILGQKIPGERSNSPGVMVRAAGMNLYERTLTRTWW